MGLSLGMTGSDGECYYDTSLERIFKICTLLTVTGQDSTDIILLLTFHGWPEYFNMSLLAHILHGYFKT